MQAKTYHDYRPGFFKVAPPKKTNGNFGEICLLHFHEFFRIYLQQNYLEHVRDLSRRSSLISDEQTPFLATTCIWNNKKT
jgi:hypothetical protein